MANSGNVFFKKSVQICDWKVEFGAKAHSDKNGPMGGGEKLYGASLG